MQPQKTFKGSLIMKKNNRLYDSIKVLIEGAKSKMVRNVNATVVLTYYHIGRIIIEDQQKGKYRADYAKNVLEQLSNQLTKEFGKGYSMTNLEYIRKFYLIYKDRIPQSLTGKSDKPRKSTASLIPQSPIEESKISFLLSWTHYIHLIKIEKGDERNFYEIEAVQGNWSVRESPQLCGDFYITT
jgi:predicted nuclease of restriction endonuclease-like (RecB) superfamily